MNPHQNVFDYIKYTSEKSEGTIEYEGIKLGSFHKDGRSWTVIDNNGNEEKLRSFKGDWGVKDWASSLIDSHIYAQTQLRNSKIPITNEWYEKHGWQDTSTGGGCDCYTKEDTILGSWTIVGQVEFYNKPVLDEIPQVIYNSLEDGIGGVGDYDFGFITSSHEQANEMVTFLMQIEPKERYKIAQKLDLVPFDLSNNATEISTPAQEYLKYVKEFSSNPNVEINSTLDVNIAKIMLKEGYSNDIVKNIIAEKSNFAGLRSDEKRNYGKSIVKEAEKLIKKEQSKGNSLLR